jgi:Fungal specific transcription factor domain
MGEGSPQNWLMSLAMLPDYTKALESSMLAIATAKVARDSGNEVLLRESLKFYINGIFELQMALWDSKSMYKDDTLAACMAMVMYEVAECPDQTMAAWLAHMKGCAKMFELRGPDAYNSDFSHGLFLSFRVLEV